MPVGTDKAAPNPVLGDWKRQIAEAIRDSDELCRRLQLPAELTAASRNAAESFPVFVTESFLSRIRAGDRNDPLLRQVLPIGDETLDVTGFSKDPVGDQQARHQPGLIQKYRGRVLLITTGLCAIHCRYCFRRHYAYQEEPQTAEQWEPALRQIGKDTTLQEVILSGGDPWVLSDGRLSQLIERLGRIGHLRRLRVHTRLPIVLPDRVTDGLLDALTSTPLTPFVVVHANHAQEIDQAVARQLVRMRSAGIVVLNQSVLLRGVNDSVEALTELSERLINLGVMPYYLSQLDRVSGAAHFEVDESRGRQLVAQMRAKLPGMAVPRFVREQAGAEHKLVLT